MTRREFLAAGAGAAALSLLPRRALAQAGPAREMYDKAITIDTLTNDGPGVDARRALAAGLSAAVVDMLMYPRNFPNASRVLKEWKTAFEAPGSLLVNVRNAQGLRAAKAQKKFGVILSSQDGQILDSSTASVNDYNLQNLKSFYDLGLRVLQLTHNEGNILGDSFREKRNAGLTRLGEKVVAAMNQHGMLIDLSHCGDQTTREAIDLSKKPCAITHAGCRALYPTARNKPDELIRAVAEKGGYFGVFNMSLWLTARDTTSIDDVVAHIEHAVKVGGVEHVGFGSDGPVVEDTTPAADALKGQQSYAQRNLGLPGAERIPSHVTVAALNGPDRLWRLADALVKRGHKTSDVEKIIGANFLRVFGEACG